MGGCIQAVKAGCRSGGLRLFTMSRLPGTRLALTCRKRPLLSAGNKPSTTESGGVLGARTRTWKETGCSKVPL